MLEELLVRYPALTACRGDIERAAQLLIDCYRRGGKLLLCGNGGSCADCEHIVGELMKGFLKKRPLNARKREKMRENWETLDENLLDKLQCGLPAISLPSMTALNTAFCNDVEPELLYAQGVLALAEEGDVLLGISTSGNAKNVCAAAEIARALGVSVLGLTGEAGGRLRTLCDCCIRVPERETFKVQELHLPIYHYLCAETEAYFFEK